MAFVVNARNKEYKENKDKDKEEKEDDFVRFTKMCSQAYNLVRKHGHFLINLLIIMVSAGK